MGAVVRYSAVDMVRDVCRADAMVQPIDQRWVRPVDGKECTAPVWRQWRTRPVRVRVRVRG